jgi:hypothetical protein
MECSVIPAKVIATCFALIAFAGALIVGMAVGNPTGTCLARALVTLLICWPIGFLLGTVAQGVNERTIAAYKKNNPIEEAPEVAAAPDQMADGAQAPPQTERKPAPPTAARV